MRMVIDTGNHSAAYAAKSSEVDVVSAYPITPQTTIIEKIAEMVERGEFGCEYIRVESEHSAMAACIGASAMGSRTFTATSSHGLELMHEMVHWAAGARTPVVMAVVNRAIGPPWNIWTDQQDSISQRDTGMIQLYCTENQEVYDTILQAYKLGESEDVTLPVMVVLEAFVLSHTFAPIRVEAQRDVRNFLPEFEPSWRMDVEAPMTFGNVGYPDGYMELREDVQKGMERARELIPEIAREFEKEFGRYHGGLVDEYKTDDAEVIVLTMGTIAQEAKESVEQLRTKGCKVGIVRVRSFRPFPGERIRRSLGNADVVVVIDRNISYGNEGALFSEVKSAMYRDERKPSIYGFVSGIGGKDVTSKAITKMVEMAVSGEAEAGYNWMAEVME